MSETEAIVCGGLTDGGRIQEDLFIIRLVEEREIKVEVRHIHGLGESYPLDKNIVFYFVLFPSLHRFVLLLPSPVPNYRCKYLICPKATLS